MAKDHGSSVKDDKTYEALRDGGASKEKAARVADAKAGGGEACMAARAEFNTGTGEPDTEG